MLTSQNNKNTNVFFYCDRTAHEIVTATSLIFGVQVWLKRGLFQPSTQRAVIGSSIVYHGLYLKGRWTLEYANTKNIGGKSLVKKSSV